jgi:transcriptional regulator with XRE-family HTH domain
VPSSISSPSRNRDLSDEQNEKLRATVKLELCNLVPKQYHLSKLLGVSQGNLSKFLDGSKGGSAALALRVAFLLDRPVEEILGVRRVPGLIDENGKRYPTRILAARAAYLDGVDPRRIQSALSAVLSPKGDPGAEAWRRMMVSGELAQPGTKEDTDWAIEVVRAGHSSETGKRRPKRAKAKPRPK